MNPAPDATARDAPATGGLRHVAAALDEDARASGAGRLDKASQEATRLLETTREEAERIVQEARDEGTAIGARLVAATRAAARRDAREIVLRARDDAYRALRRRVLEELARRSDTDEVARLNLSLDRRAMRLLGSGATLRRDPLGVGLVAAAGAHRIDSSAESLVDACLDGLGQELERLWS